MSHSSEVHLRVSESAGGVEVVIADNGCGFDPQQPRPGRKGHGLDNMRKRMQGLGGEVRLEPTPGQGTRLRFTLRFKP